jgi:hypothetical protein
VTSVAVIYESATRINVHVRIRDVRGPSERYESNSRWKNGAARAGAKNNGFKALTSQHITYANAPRATKNKEKRRKEADHPSPLSREKTVAICPYLDVHGTTVKEQSSLEHDS